MNYEIKLENTELEPTLSVRIITSMKSLPKEIGKANKLISTYIEEISDKSCIKKPFTAYYNEDMENFDVEIGYILKKPLEGNEEINASTIPKAKKATTIYKGPYSDMEPAFSALRNWIKENGYESTGVSYEIYLNSSKEVPKEELLTEIFFLLK